MSAAVVAHSDSGGWLADVGSVTIEIPAAAQPDDVLVVTGYTEADVGPSGALLDGWLPSAAVAPWDDQWWHYTWVLRRDQVTAGLIDWGGETTWAAWRVEVIRGADLRAAPSISTDADFGTEITAPSVTASAGGVLIWVVATDTARPSVTPPPGMELIGSVTPWSFAIVAAEEPSVDGPTGPRTGTWPEPTGWTVTLIAVHPAPTGPTVWLHTGSGLARCVVRDHTGTPAVLHTGD